MEALRLFKVAREYITPVLHESNFLQRGMLTPEEFVIAGDQIVSTCPTWSWCAGDAYKRRPYLPAEKQFLITKGVPCYRRVTQMNKDQVIEQNIESNLKNDNESWCATDLAIDDNNSQQHNENEDDNNFIPTILIDRSNELPIENNNDTSSNNNNDNNMTIGKIVIDENHFAGEAGTSSELSENANDFIDESLALDESAILSNTFPPPPPKVIVPPSQDTYIRAIAPNDNDDTEDDTTNNNNFGESNILRSRRYDLTITYDNYYRTPRIWLFGVNENGTPLSPYQIYEDIMVDYAKKTVTVDPHPYLTKPHASIHPCQHGAAMKRIIDALQSCQKTPSVDQYMFIFLKFIQSVIPTIEYDYTMDVTVRG